MNWGYLEDLMALMNFLLKWRDWMQECLSTFKVSILVIGLAKKFHAFKAQVKDIQHHLCSSSLSQQHTARCSPRKAKCGMQKNRHLLFGSIAIEIILFGGIVIVS